LADTEKKFLLENNELSFGISILPKKKNERKEKRKSFFKKFFLKI